MMNPAFFFYFFQSIYTLCLIVLVILWLQSGIDKITDYKGNFEWLNGHFSKSALKGMVKPLLITLTFFELSAGIASIAAIVDVWLIHSWYPPFIACFLSMLSFTCLFFGQRMAKDYGSAASIVGYIVFTIFTTFFTIALYFYVTSLHKLPIPVRLF
jgi:hypothetical protein